jgi:hypothetical protein
MISALAAEVMTPSAPKGVTLGASIGVADKPRAFKARSYRLEATS